MSETNADAPAIETVFIEDIEVGMSRSRNKVVTERDIELFGEVSGDRNPVHFDEEFAKTTMFKTRIAHGMLSASIFSALLGTQLPGQGSIYLKQDIRFLAPVKLGDTVVGTVTVSAIDRDRRRVTLDCVCTVGDTPVIKGEAQVIAPSKDA